MHNAPDGPVEPEGLPADDIDVFFSGLKPFSRLAVAVSGGADSLCLMVLFSEWKLRSHWPGHADILVVDHGLRPESAKEAGFVARSAQQAGLAAHILKWEGEKPHRNVQETARRARYELISDHMRRSGAQALVLGHHMDDQAETFLDRLSRGSGLRGLSGMAADERDGPEGLRLLRPLLSVPKKRLEASLRERGLTWCSDPSNQDRKYKRSRLRQVLSLLEEEGLSAERIARTADRLRLSREALDTALEEISVRLLAEHPAGPAKFERNAYRSIAEDLRLRLLSFLVCRVTGIRSRIRLQKLQALDDALMQDGDYRGTLAGALVEADLGAVWCWREPGRNPPETLSDLNGEGTWDHRYRFSVPPHSKAENGGPSLYLGPLVSAPIRSRDIEWPKGWPKEAFRCAPVIWDENGKILSLPVSAHIHIDGNDSDNQPDLVRMPFRVKLDANYLDNGDTDLEI